MSRRNALENFFFRGTALPTAVRKNQPLVPRSNLGGKVCARTDPWFRGQILPVLGHGGGGGVPTGLLFPLSWHPPSPLQIPTLLLGISQRVPAHYPPPPFAISPPPGKGKQPNTEALCHPPPPPRRRLSLGDRLPPPQPGDLRTLTREIARGGKGMKRTGNLSQRSSLKVKKVPKGHPTSEHVPCCPASNHNSNLCSPNFPHSQSMW